MIVHRYDTNQGTPNESTPTDQEEYIIEMSQALGISRGGALCICQEDKVRIGFLFQGYFAEGSTEKEALENAEEHVKEQWFLLSNRYRSCKQVLERYKR